MKQLQQKSYECSKLQQTTTSLSSMLQQLDSLVALLMLVKQSIQESNQGDASNEATIQKLSGIVSTYERAEANLDERTVAYLTESRNQSEHKKADVEKLQKELSSQTAMFRSYGRDLEELKNLTTNYEYLLEAVERAAVSQEAAHSPIMAIKAIKTLLRGEESDIGVISPQNPAIGTPTSKKAPVLIQEDFITTVSRPITEARTVGSHSPHRGIQSSTSHHQQILQSTERQVPRPKDQVKQSLSPAGTQGDAKKQMETLALQANEVLKDLDNAQEQLKIQEEQIQQLQLQNSHLTAELQMKQASQAELDNTNTEVLSVLVREIEELKQVNTKVISQLNQSKPASQASPSSVTQSFFSPGKVQANHRLSENSKEIDHPLDPLQNRNEAMEDILLQIAKTSKMYRKEIFASILRKLTVLQNEIQEMRKSNGNRNSDPLESFLLVLSNSLNHIESNVKILSFKEDKTTSQVFELLKVADKDSMKAPNNGSHETGPSLQKTLSTAMKPAVLESRLSHKETTSEFQASRKQLEARLLDENKPEQQRYVTPSTRKLDNREAKPATTSRYQSETKLSPAAKHISVSITDQSHGLNYHSDHSRGAVTKDSDDADHSRTVQPPQHPDRLAGTTSDSAAKRESAPIKRRPDYDADHNRVALSREKKSERSLLQVCEQTKSPCNLLRSSLLAVRLHIQNARLITREML